MSGKAAGTTPFRATALAAYDAGLCPLPPKGPRKAEPKSPMCEQLNAETVARLKLPDGLAGKWTWKHFQLERPPREKVEAWYANGRKWLGVVCGAVSGGLELFEFDCRETYEAFVATARRLGLGDQVDRLEAGYCEDTPSGGVHWFYYCDELKGNAKLAQRPAPTPENPDNVEVLIETRGEGGFAVIAPTTGLHDNGRSYVLRSGGVGSIATITGEERRALWDLARTFDRMPVADAPPDPAASAGGGDDWTGGPSAGPDPFNPFILHATNEPSGQGAESPWKVMPSADFEARATWDEVLVGWARDHTHDGVTYWRRPGKDHAWSATTGFGGGGRDLLKVFSTSTPFDPETWYGKHRAYVLLKHKGDYKAAHNALAERGYGVRNESGGPKGEARGRHQGHAAAPGEPPPAGGAADDDPGPPQFNLTDLGNAERLVAQYGGLLRYCHPWKRWLNWDGRRWAPDNTAVPRRLARKVVRSIYREAGTEAGAADRSKALAKWAMMSEQRERIAALLALAEAEDGIPVVPDEMDRDPWSFNCANGTIDLRAGRLRPHRRADLITKLCPLDYDPAAPCPLWESTLALFFGGNDDLIGFWRRLMGYALTGVVRDHIMPVAYGVGSNGKSTILGTTLEVFGPDYGMKAVPDMLMAKRSDGHPTDRADLFGKRLVVAIESEAGRRLSESMVKELTGGDRIRARRMREDFWEFSPTHTLVMATNHKPVVRGTDHGIWRRLKLVPFAVTVDGSRADLAMPEKLRAEHPGILAWCVRGCLEWQERGLDAPAEVVDATKVYRQEQDVLGAFLDECTLRKEGCKARAGELYARYRQWAEAGNEHAMTQTMFGLALEERGYQKKTSNGVWYLGLGLPDPKTDGGAGTPSREAGTL